MIIQVSLSQEEYNQVQDKSKEMHLSMSALARTLIMQNINNNGAK